MNQDVTQKMDDVDTSEFLNAVERRSHIRIIAYAMSQSIEKTLARMTEQLLRYYQRDDLTSLVYTAVKELAINGVKANLKRVYFGEAGLSIDNPEQYEQGMQQYRTMMTEQEAHRLGRIARTMGLFVKITFIHGDHGLKIEVRNNSGVTPQEQERLRTNMKKALDYSDLMDFYLQNTDESEGAGMGLALIISLIKSSGLDPNLLRIVTSGHETTARLEIPFDNLYEPSRSRGINYRS